MLASSYPRYAGDGAGSFVASLARALVARGHTVHVVAPFDTDGQAMDHGGVSVERFRYAPAAAWHIAGHGRALQADRRMKWAAPLLMPGYAASAAASMARQARRERLDVLHAHWAVPGGAIGAWVARRLGLPLVLSLHGSDVYVIERQRLYAAAARGAFRQASRTVACSEDLRARAVAVGLPAERSLVIPYGVDSARYAQGDDRRLRALWGLPQDAPVIGALGRLVHKKGFVTLIAAMPAVLLARPDAYCVIGGQGDLEAALHAQIARLGLSERVLLPGHVSWQETADFYALCQVLAVPSVVDTRGNVDGLPNVLLEGMASGCAVVASRVAGIPDVVRDGEHGLLVPPGDAAALSAALLRLLDDTPLRQRLGANAQALMRAEFSWDGVAARYEALYEEARRA